MSQPAVGIDLGTTYSALAVINPAGKPEIVPNPEGERMTDSAVWFQPDGRTLVGLQAVRVAGSYPDRVVRWVKREMGDPNWRFEVDGRSYRPEDISALILKKVKEDTERTLGPIEHAVVTVPAYFDDVRRRATIAAAQEAGLTILRIINEPTAAGIAYAQTGRVSGTCLIYDFGGGTFDVSIVRINPPYEVEVVTSEGDQRCGGYDIDCLLAEHYNALVERDVGVHLWPPVPSTGIDFGADIPPEKRGMWHELVGQGERDKRGLSNLLELLGVNVG